MRQTAVNFLIEQIIDKQPAGFYVIDSQEECYKLFEKARQMEKEQIAKASKKTMVIKQTSVQWLHEIVMNHLSHEKQMQLEGLFQQAEKMEKEQIISAWLAGFKETRPYVDPSEDYYKQTYESNTNL